MTFTLPDLPYSYDALEPIIDEETMHLHHDKHHQTYVNNANKGLENTEFKNHSAEGLLRIFNELPEEIRPLVRQNVGGHYNHSLYWQILGGEGGEPNGQLLQAIEQTFGSFSEFQQQFLSVATGRFGSGWAWLVVNNGELELVSTPNQDSPLMDGLIPIFGVDVWEHAYYLNYRNVRPDYIKAIWKIVNWDKVSELYEKAL
ncbi:superoxide dismutase [Aerococcus suis]|uniref:Superoxide dismutase n=1 Tax=Aerococcus suis TaxID=371602 RepID=A0A1W1Y375_9LACT|nr:superoxide dismutase [Aerococcus suis]MCI7240552.1 superoxide dismutase [Aerococcus suis]MDD7757981.1 superoxide dismutase [Aerococcus suis]MDY4647199.1 superoxide dismutase [Aerococcus suis]SMC30271.1 superoxide dismutase, Fe-Mn family [Aerococcus suis]